MPELNERYMLEDLSLQSNYGGAVQQHDFTVQIVEVLRHYGTGPENRTYRVQYNINTQSRGVVELTVLASEFYYWLVQLLEICMPQTLQLKNAFGEFSFEMQRTLKELNQQYDMQAEAAGGESDCPCEVRDFWTKVAHLFDDAASAAASAAIRRAA